MMGRSEVSWWRVSRQAVAVGSELGQTGWILTVLAAETGLLAAALASGKIPPIVFTLFRALLTL